MCIASERARAFRAYWFGDAHGQKAIAKAVRANLGDEEIERIPAEDNAKPEATVKRVG